MRALATLTILLALACQAQAAANFTPRAFSAQGLRTMTPDQPRFHLAPRGGDQAGEACDNDRLKKRKRCTAAPQPGNPLR